MGVVVNKPRVLNIITIIFLIMWLVRAININLFADFDLYQNIYNHILFGPSGNNYQTGVGWYVLNRIGQYFNLNYFDFKLYINAICLIIIGIIVKSFLGNDYNCFWGMYLLYPALRDA